MQHEPGTSSRGYSRLKLLLGGVIGMAVATPIMYFVFGPKGILYMIVGLIAYLSGQLFLKVFKP
jgi:hypothetical protein